MKNTAILPKTELEQLVSEALKTAKKAGANQAEASASSSDGFSVTTRMAEVETIENHIGKHFAITVYFDKRTGSASSSDFAKESIAQTIAKACSIARYTQKDSCAGLANAKLMAHDYQDLDLYHPSDFAIPDAINMARECEEIALAYNKKIFNSEGANVAAAQNIGVYGNSHGFIGTIPSTMYSVSCGVLARNKQEMQHDYDYTVARNINNLTSHKKIAETAAKRAVKRLNAKQIKTQKCAVIFAADCAKSLIGSFISAISGGNLYRKASFLTNSLDKKVFPTFIEIDEKPHLHGELGSTPFDAEGVATKERVLVKNGIVQSYVLSSYTARKLKMQTTANAGGVHNLFVKHGNKDLTALIKMVDRGLLVVELMGQGVNLVTGDYSRGIFGYWIENGIIQHPVAGVTIAGNLKTMFNSIVAVGSDVDNRSNIHTGSILVTEMMAAGD